MHIDFVGIFTRQELVFRCDNRMLEISRSSTKVDVSVPEINSLQW